MTQSHCTRRSRRKNPIYVSVSIAAALVVPALAPQACVESGSVPAPAEIGDASSDRSLPRGDRDASEASDASHPDASHPDAQNPIEGGADASCPGTIVTTPGETCIGYGTGEMCDPACGQSYGYVCFGGAPPSFAGCREYRKSDIVGNGYCCPTNACVHQPDRSADCAGAPGGKTKRYQCPPAVGGGNVAPPAGCVEHGSGATALEKFYCCP